MYGGAFHYLDFFRNALRNGRLHRVTGGQYITNLHRYRK